MKVNAKDLQVVTFNGGELRAFRDPESRIWVQAKHVAEALGLRWHGQLEHLQRDGTLKDTIRVIRMVSPNPTNPEETIERETVFIERRGLVLWLAKLQPSRVKDPERRKKIIAYQKEAARALEDYFFRGAAVNPRAAIDPEILRMAIDEAVTRALDRLETKERREDPELERIKLAQKLLKSAKEIPGVDPRWLERCHEIVLHETLGKPYRKEKLTVDLSQFMRERLGRRPQKGELISFGRFVGKLYRQEFGQDPPKRLVVIEGRETPINSFTRDDLAFLEWAFLEWAAEKGISIQRPLPAPLEEDPKKLN